MFEFQNTNIEHSTSNIERRSKREPSSYAAPLFVWLVIQLIAIGLAAARVKLWAKFSAEGETVALDELLVAQFIASSLLFPFLCRDFKSTIAITLAGVAMCGLVGILSFNSLDTCGQCALNLLMWLLGLAVWWKVVNAWTRGIKGNLPLSPTAALIAVAVVSSLNLCGPILAYFQAESNGFASPAFRAIPIIAVVRQAHDATFSGYIPSAAVLILGIGALLVRRASLSTAVIH
jgi:hypothetical protein